MAFVYSCCFWFSLRLGGILIGGFSLALVILIFCGLGYTYNDWDDEISELIYNYNLIYAKEYLNNIKEDPVKYISFTVTLTCFYILACIMFIYGAYVCNNVFMVCFILFELLRLILFSGIVGTGLLILKQNTMDIGVLIGASVAGGFLLLGMFYLWICCANLPILINEMERDEQSKTIAKLQTIIQKNNYKTQPFDVTPAFQLPDRRQQILVTPIREYKHLKTKNIRPAVPVSYY